MTELELFTCCIVLLVFIAVAFYFIGYIMGMSAYFKEDDEFPKCDCRDVNMCDKWCIGKENFTKYHP